MKTIKLLSWLALGIFLASCAEQAARPKEVLLTKEKVHEIVQTAYWHVASVTKTQDGVTTPVDLGIYERSRDQVFLEFRPSGRTQFYSGSPATLPDYPEPAKIFTLTYRIPRPVNIEYYWDDVKDTFVFTSVDAGGFEIVPIGERVYLDKSSIAVYHTLEEVNAAKASTSMQLVSIFKENQPGEAKYTYTLKRLMHVQYHPSFLHLRYMVEY